jgi:hypothetical protein
MEEDGQRITVEVIREAMASCALRTRAASDNDRRVARPSLVLSLAKRRGHARSFPLMRGVGIAS